MADNASARADQGGTNPAEDWARLRDGARSDEQRARVAAATRQADMAWITLHTGQRSGQGGIPPRGPIWYQLAIRFHNVLDESGAYGHLAQRRTWTCAAPESIISAWLHAPADATSADTRGDEPQTTAQRLGVDDAFTIVNGDTQAAHLSTLLDAAQDAHVFGVPGHRVELVTATRHHNGATVVRLVADTPHGTAVASEPLELGVLADADRHGVEAATAALGRVADVVTAMFTDQANAVWQAPPPMPVADRAAIPAGRAFPDLRLDEVTEQAAPPRPAPSAAATPRTPDDTHQGRTR